MVKTIVSEHFTMVTNEMCILNAVNAITLVRLGNHGTENLVVSKIKVGQLRDFETIS